MHFSTEKQRHAVCRALLATIGRADLWTADGPTEDAVRLEAAAGTDFDEKDRTLFLVVWELHHQHRKAGVSLLDVMFRLGDVPKLALLRLLLCYASRGSRGVDAWLDSVDKLATLDEGLLGIVDGPLGHRLARALVGAAQKKPGTGRA